MRRLWIALVPLLLVLVAGPAGAQVSALDAAASALRSTPVYVDDAAERARDVDVDRLRALIRRGDRPIFIAILPASAANDAGGSVNEVPAALARKVGLRGTYGVVTGTSFRAGSTDLPTGLAATLATDAFQERRDDGVGAVLEDVRRPGQRCPGREQLGERSQPGQWQ